MNALSYESTKNLTELATFAELELTGLQAAFQQRMQDIWLSVSPRFVDVSCLLTLFVVVGLVARHRFEALRKRSLRAEREASKRIRETDDVTDELLQGVQGLLLTFHVATQNISEDHASRKLMNHALSEADELVSTGRRRFERAAFQLATEERLTVQGEDLSAMMDDLKHNYLESHGREGKD